MIIKRNYDGQDGIAEWHYDFFEAGMGSISIFDPKDQIKKKNRIEVLTSILSILAKHSLFDLAKITVEGVINPEKNKAGKFFSINGGINFQNLEELIQANAAAKFKEKFFARSISLFGNSSILSEQGKETIYEGVFLIQFTFFDIRIITDCDAWLPYDINAKEQSNIYQLNAPRLKAALEEIEATTNIEPTWENTKYAIVDKYTIKNYEDELGNAIDVTQA